MQLPGIEFCLEDFVHVLLALDSALAGKFVADNQRLKVLTVTIEGEVFAGHAGANEFFDLFGMHRVQALSFQPRFSRFSVNNDTATKQATTTVRLISGATSETPKKP